MRPVRPPGPGPGYRISVSDDMVRAQDSRHREVARKGIYVLAATLTGAWIFPVRELNAHLSLPRISRAITIFSTSLVPS